MTERQQKQTRKEAVRARKAAFRARQRTARRLLVAIAVWGGVTALGLVGILVSSNTPSRTPATWVVVATGVVALVLTGLLVTRELVALRPMGWLGRSGIICVGVVPVWLLGGQALVAAGIDAAGGPTAILALIPAVVGGVLLGAEHSGPGDGHDNNATVTMMSDLSNLR